MKKISFLIFFIGLFILTSCNYSKVENITTSKTDEIQTTTEVPKKTLTADEVVALFNAKYDLFSENCEFDTDVSIFLFGKDGDCSESSYSEKCKYIDGKANYSVSTPDVGMVEYIWDGTYFVLDSRGKVDNKLDVPFERFFSGNPLSLYRRIESYTDVEQTETDSGTEYSFKLPDDDCFTEVLCNRETKIIVDNRGNLSYYECSVSYVQGYEYEEGKTYPYDEYTREIRKVKFNSTENVQIDLSQYEDELNSFVPTD